MSLTIGCRKARYKTRSEAVLFSRKLIATGADRNPDVALRPYFCTRCDAWHFGHDPDAETDE